MERARGTPPYDANPRHSRTFHISLLYLPLSPAFTHTHTQHTTQVQGALGKLNSTLEGKWAKVLADGLPASKAPKAKLPDLTPALDAVLPPSFKAIVTPPSRRSDEDQVVYDDTLGAVVKVSEQAALLADFEANKAAAEDQSAAAEEYRQQADAQIAATNADLAEKAAEAKAEGAAASETAAEAAAAAAVPEGKGTAAVAAAPAAVAAPAKKAAPAPVVAPAKKAAAAPVAAPAKKAAPAPAAAPSKGAEVAVPGAEPGVEGALASFKQAPARNATISPKLEVSPRGLETGDTRARARPPPPLCRLMDGCMWGGWDRGEHTHPNTLLTRAPPPPSPHTHPPHAMTGPGR